MSAYKAPNSRLLEDRDGREGRAESSGGDVVYVSPYRAYDGLPPPSYICSILLEPAVLTPLPSTLPTCNRGGAEEQQPIEAAAKVGYRRPARREQGEEIERKWVGRGQQGSFTWGPFGPSMAGGRSSGLRCGGGEEARGPHEV